MNSQKGSRETERSWWWYATLGAMALLLGLGTLGVINLLARPLALLILGISLAASVAPLVEWLTRWLPRTLTVVLLYLVLLGILVGIGWIVVPPLVAQGQDLVNRVPELIDQAERFFNRWSVVSDGSLVDTLLSQLGTLSSALVSLPVALSSSLLEILVVVALSAYMLVLIPGMRSFAISLVSDDMRPELLDTVGEIGSAMGGYIRGTVLNGAVVGVVTYIGLVIIDVNFSLVLAIIAGGLETIPNFGPIISGLIITLFALLQSPTKAIIAFLFFLVLQQVENQILVPNIMRSQTAVSPLLIIFALMAGGQIGGVLGVLAAIPLAAGLRVFAVRVVAPAVRQRTGAELETEEGEQEQDESA